MNSERRAPLQQAVHIFTGILQETWHILNESSLYLLFGLLMAGMVKVLMSEKQVAAHLGGRGAGPVFKAALIGVPLPLCSCGVVPAAMGLRKQGSSKGATAAFMISTPESGIDSIAITWALLDPLMTVVRPVAAFFGASLAGLSINALVEEKPDGNPPSCPSGEG
jgi:hypothetical protein